MKMQLFKQICVFVQLSLPFYLFIFSAVNVAIVVVVVVACTQNLLKLFSCTAHLSAFFLLVLVFV